MVLNTDFDIESLRLATSEVKSVRRSKGLAPYRTKSGELFLKGPIPWQWLMEAAQARGKALHVGVALWFYAGLTKSKTVSLNLSRLPFSRDSARRGLRALEEKKLVRVTRHAGRKPVITILLKQSRKKEIGKIAIKHNGNGKESSMRGEI